jgi:hypothetical protein
MFFEVVYQHGASVIKMVAKKLIFMRLCGDRTLPPSNALHG